MRHYHVPVPVGVEVARANEVGSDRHGEDSPRREERSGRKWALRPPRLGFGQVRVEGINVATQQCNETAACVCIATDQVRDAIFIKVSTRQCQWLGFVLL